MQTQVVLEKKKGLLHLFRVDQVIVFYPKTMNKWQSKKYFETKSLFKEL